MERRTLLRLLAAGGALPVLEGLSPADLLALGRRAAGHAPRVLSPAQAALVAEVAEIIIPATDTPGARAAGVDGFVDLMLAEQVDDAARAEFLAGLDRLDADARATHGAPFLACTPAERLAMVVALDDALDRERQAGGVEHNRFFQRMKGWTLAGYYTSEVGVTQELKAPIIPGRWDGCVPLPVPAAGEAP